MKNSKVILMLHSSAPIDILAVSAEVIFPDNATTRPASVDIAQSTTLERYIGSMMAGVAMMPDDTKRVECGVLVQIATESDVEIHKQSCLLITEDGKGIIPEKMRVIVQKLTAVEALALRAQRNTN